MRKVEKEPENKNLHLVLHSSPHAEKYFHCCFQEVKELLSNDLKNHNISSITSSNYYSLVAFLHANDLTPL